MWSRSRRDAARRPPCSARSCAPGGVSAGAPCSWPTTARPRPTRRRISAIWTRCSRSRRPAAGTPATNATGGRRTSRRTSARARRWPRTGCGRGRRRASAISSTATGRRATPPCASASRGCSCGTAGSTVPAPCSPTSSRCRRTSGAATPARSRSSTTSLPTGSRSPSRTSPRTTTSARRSCTRCWPAASRSTGAARRWRSTTTGTRS